MRADMAKVIVERPRIGSRARGAAKGYRRSSQRLGVDEQPRREGMKRRAAGGTKSLNEHLGPLRRYLNSQVGRPWDKVFSEICAHIDRTSAVQDHVRDHVAQYVAEHVILIDGVPCDGAGGWHYGEPLHQLRYRPWYVCPRTGLLRRVKVSSRKRQRTPKQPSPSQFVRVSDTLQCRLVGNAWHLVELKPLPHDPRDARRSLGTDVLLNRPVAQLTPDDLKKHYGAEVYATSIRRLAKRELSQYPIPIDLW